MRELAEGTRDFDVMPRFVILLHEMPGDSARPTHWDLMLEDDAILLTWALEAFPEQGLVSRAQSLPDHRPAYLTYQGPVSHNRGSVTRWEQGEFRWLQRSSQTLRIQVSGQRLDGQICMTRNDPLAEDWQIVYLGAKH
jgi:hypothetical protein